MAGPILTQKKERHAVIVSMVTGHSVSEIAAFLKLTLSFSFKLRSKRKAACCDVATFSTGNNIVGVLSLSGRRNIVSMRILGSLEDTRQGASEWRDHFSTCDSRAPSLEVECDKNRAVLVREALGEWIDKNQAPVKELKHPTETAMLCFFSNEKNFVEVNHKNIIGFVRSPKRFRKLCTEHFLLHWWFEESWSVKKTWCLYISFSSVLVLTPLHIISGFYRKT